MKLDINKIPTKPGVYFFQTGTGKNLYIGKAKNLKKRISQYFSSNSIWKQDMIAKATKLDFLIVESENEAILLENNLIRKYRPAYNSLIKGDNSYVYIKISNEDFPSISFTRFRENDGAVYIGPKNQRKELIKLTQLLRQLFKYRGCKNIQFNKGKLCSDYLFGLCTGRCIYNKLAINPNSKALEEAQKLGFKNEFKNGNYSQEYKKNLDMIISFFKGRTKKINEYIIEEISKSIEKQHFEWAAKLRDILFNIKNLTETQSIILDPKIDGYFCKIKKIGTSFVYSIVNFYEGKLIDSLRFKEDEEDLSVDELIIKIQTELGDMKSKKDENGNIYLHSKSIKINKKQFDEVFGVMDNFIDSFIISSSFSKENILSNILDGIKEKFKLEKYPYKVECIDISHLSGGWISGGLSCFVGGLSDKRLYRKYKIKGEFTGGKTTNNDYAALKEIIYRRFKNSPNQDWPDILIIDGGKGQLNIIKQLLKEDKLIKDIHEVTQFLALEKGKARKRAGKITGEKETLHCLSKDLKITSQEFNYDEYDRLLVKIRDEAHRFANYFRQQQMKKEFK